jgi:hypothetical protein
MASKVIATTRNGSDRSHSKGQRMMAKTASGQHNTNRRHQPTITSNAFTGVSPCFLDATLAYPLAVVGQRKADTDAYKESADAAIEPLFELVAGPEPAADSRRRPGDQQIPNRAVEIEDDAEEQECQGLRRRIRQNKLRQKREKKQRNLGIQDICEKALQKDAPHRGRLAASGN